MLDAASEGDFMLLQDLLEELEKQNILEVICYECSKEIVSG